MPNRDQTGPIGQGPETGRRLGYCGNGCRKTGLFHSFGRMFLSKKESSEELETVRDNLKADLAAVEEEIANLSK